MNKLWIFRLAACGIPSILGLVVIAYLLYDREQLVVENGGLRIQPAPLYVQEDGHEKTGHKYLYDAELGWINIPNWKATTFGQPLTTNSKNLRDREYSYEKPEGWRRILVLGDSFAWGYGVADDAIFTEVLEDGFHRRGIPWQVINTGVSGWGTDQQYLYFAREGKKYAPDIVVVAFYLGNDPGNCASAVQYGLHKPIFMDLDLTLQNVPVPKPPVDTTKPPLKSKVGRHELVVRIIEQLATECDQAGAKLVLMKFGVFQFPSNPTVLSADADFHANLARIRSRIHYLDLDQEFSRRSLTKPQLTQGVDDGHWNPDGHRIVAEILESFLDSQSLLH